MFTKPLLIICFSVLVESSVSDQHSLEVYSSMWSMFSMCIAVRSISGHKAAICSLDFHRYGDILASGSMDTNLKVQPNFVL